MSRQLDAVYEQGVLRPLEPLALSEHQRVSSEPVNERREELQWLAQRSGPYGGQWAALEGDRLVAHGDKLAAVSAEAKAAGVEEPLFAHVPAEEGLPFAGW